MTDAPKSPRDDSSSLRKESDQGAPEHGPTGEAAAQEAAADNSRSEQAPRQASADEQVADGAQAKTSDADEHQQRNAGGQDEQDKKPTAEENSAAIASGHRWLRVSLKSMLALILIFSLGFAWYARRLREQEDRQIVPTSWDLETGKNVKWTAKLGSNTYATPVIAGGKVFVGTNNAAGHLKRFPAKQDLGVLLCFNEDDGKLLWQASSPKLKNQWQDWRTFGVISTPTVEGDRLWYVTNRGEVVCLDTEGFRDGENDGPYRREDNENPDEADIVWSFDMINRLGVWPHNASLSSVVISGSRLFVATSNGMDAGHVKIANPSAPSFLCLDKRTGAALW